MSSPVPRAAGSSPPIPPVTRRDLGDCEWIAAADAALPSRPGALRDLVTALAAAAPVPGSPGHIQPVLMPPGAGMALLHFRHGQVTTYCDSRFILPAAARALSSLSDEFREQAQVSIKQNPRAYRIITGDCRRMRKEGRHPAALEMPGTSVIVTVCARLVSSSMCSALTAVGAALAAPCPPGGLRVPADVHG